MLSNGIHFVLDFQRQRVLIGLWKYFFSLAAACFSRQMSISVKSVLWWHCWRRKPGLRRVVLSGLWSLIPWTLKILVPMPRGPGSVSGRSREIGSLALRGGYRIGAWGTRRGIRRYGKGGRRGIVRVPCTRPWANCLEGVTVLVTMSANVGCKCSIARLILSNIVLPHLVSWYLQSGGLWISSSAWSIPATCRHHLEEQWKSAFGGVVALGQGIFDGAHYAGKTVFGL